MKSKKSSQKVLDPFWKSLTTEELMEIQGVSPVSNLDELSALWPADDDPDELLDYILSERTARHMSIRLEDNK